MSKETSENPLFVIARTMRKNKCSFRDAVTGVVDLTYEVEHDGEDLGEEMTVTDIAYGYKSMHPCSVLRAIPKDVAEYMDKTVR